MKYLSSDITKKARQNAPIGNCIVKYGVYENVDRTLPPAFIYDRARLALNKSKHNYGVKVAMYDTEQSEELVRKKFILNMDLCRRIPLSRCLKRTASSGGWITMFPREYARR